MTPTYAASTERLKHHIHPSPRPPSLPKRLTLQPGLPGRRPNALIPQRQRLISNAHPAGDPVWPLAQNRIIVDDNLVRVDAAKLEVRDTRRRDLGPGVAQQLQHRARVEAQDAGRVARAEDFGRRPGEQDAEVGLGEVGRGERVEDVWAWLAGVGCGGRDDALGFLQVRGPFVEAFAEDREDVAPAAGRGVAGEGFGAQPGCGGALDRERPEVEEHDGVLGGDLGGEAGCWAWCEEGFVGGWGVGGGVVDGFDELDGGGGAEGVACETDGAWFVDS